MHAFSPRSSLALTILTGREWFQVVHNLKSFNSLSIENLIYYSFCLLSSFSKLESGIVQTIEFSFLSPQVSTTSFPLCRLWSLPLFFQWYLAYTPFKSQVFRVHSGAISKQYINTIEFRRSRLTMKETKK